MILQGFVMKQRAGSPLLMMGITLLLSYTVGFPFQRVLYLYYIYMQIYIVISEIIKNENKYIL